MSATLLCSRQFHVFNLRGVFSVDAAQTDVRGGLVFFPVQCRIFNTRRCADENLLGRSLERKRMPFRLCPRLLVDTLHAYIILSGTAEILKRLEILVLHNHLALAVSSKRVGLHLLGAHYVAELGVVALAELKDILGGIRDAVEFQFHRSGHQFLHLKMGGLIQTVVTGVYVPLVHVFRTSGESPTQHHGQAEHRP